MENTLLNKMEIISLKNVSKAFGGVIAVNNVSMGFYSGKITGLIGPNGAGKTTIFNLISGLIKVDKGRIYFKGENITNLHPWEISKKGIGRLFQDIRVFKKLTVLENVILGEYNPAEYPYNILFKFKEIKKIEKENREKAIELIKFVGLEGKENTPAENLSYGQQKLLSLARLLMGKYEVLLMDEPTAGVHPDIVKKLIELMKEMAKSGKTIIFIEHNMNIVSEIADWLFFLKEGEVYDMGKPEDILGDEEIRRIYMGIGNAKT